MHRRLNILIPRVIRQRSIHEKISTKPFAVISNNCWGAHIYQSAGLPYTTPFIGLWLSPTAYLHLLANWARLIHTPLRFTAVSGEQHIESIRQSLQNPWPVGILGGEVEIQFLHYATQSEALDKWTRRLQRMPTNIGRLFFKFDDREGCTHKQMEIFTNLPFPNKVLFVANQQLTSIPGTVYIPANDDVVPDGLTLSRITPKYFDAAAWIGGRPQPSSKILSFI